MSSIIGYGSRLAERARAVPAIAVDAVIAVACYLFVAIPAATSDHLRWWALLLAAGNAAPLLWRRRYPFAVTWVAGGFTTGLALAGALGGEFAAAQLVATYTFAALCGPVKRLILVLGTVAGISLSILPHGEHLGPLGLTVVMFVAAYALGTGARARRDRISMLEERTRRFAEQRDAAAARERERIAREMHDIIAHSMSLVVVQAEAGPVAVRSDPAKAEAVFDTISATARDALGQLRRALGVLRAGGTGEPLRTPQPGLDALPALLRRAEETGLAVRYEQRGAPRPVPPDLATTAYRIVQESLTNTVKHARAGTVWVRVRWRDDALQLEVRDDGRGPAGNGGSGGQGLVGMRERVAVLGGELATGAGPDGAGFQVTATLPVQ